MFDNSKIPLVDLEKLENKYLLKYWHFLMSVQDDLLKGIESMKDIWDDWFDKYDDSKSKYSVGCERIVYALLNGKMVGFPNSTPVSSDLFFEVDDAFIHIDLKSVTTDDTVTAKNINDFKESISVEKNQNSYHGFIHKKKGVVEEYIPNLPTFYTKTDGSKKICLTYFVCLLNNESTFKTELISIMCMPNGRLYEKYGDDPLKAGKQTDDTRFHFAKIPKFKLIGENRVKVVYVNPDMSANIKDKLDFYFKNFI